MSNDDPTTDPAADTYGEVRNRIYHTCIRFSLKYGGDVDELVSEAHLHYMRAYRRYDPAEGPFTAWIKFVVHNCLLETVRRSTRQNAILKRQHGADLALVNAASAPQFSVPDLDDGLGGDAGEVLELALAAPRVNLTPVAIRNELRKHLRRQGWTKERIDSAFAEVRSAL